MYKELEEEVMLEQSYYDKADMIIEEHGAKPQALIPIIQDIQAEYPIYHLNCYVM